MPVAPSTSETQWVTADGEIRNLYKIDVNRDPREIQRVTEMLFKHGFVYGSIKRYKTFTWLEYSCSIDEWQFLKFNFDEECKSVFGALSYFDGALTKQRYQTVTIDEFLYEIHNFPRPAESPIITLEQFNKEFEKFQKEKLVVNNENNPRLTYQQEAEILEALRRAGSNDVIFTARQGETTTIDHIRPISTNNDDTIQSTQAEVEELEREMRQVNEPPLTAERPVPPPAPDNSIGYMDLVSNDRRSRRRGRIVRRTTRLQA